MGEVKRPPVPCDRERVRRALLEEGDSVDRADEAAANVRALVAEDRAIGALASIVDRELYVRWCDRFRTPPVRLNRALENFRRSVVRSLGAHSRLPVRSAVTDRWAANLTAMGEEAESLLRETTDPRKDETEKRQRLVGWVLYMLLWRDDARLDVGLPAVGVSDHPEGFASRVVQALCRTVRYPFPEDDKARRLILRRAFDGLRAGGVRLAAEPAKRARSRRGREKIAPSRRK